LVKLIGEKEDAEMTAELLPDLFAHQQATVSLNSQQATPPLNPQQAAVPLNSQQATNTLNSHQVAMALIALQLMQNVFTEFQLGLAANRANPRNAGWVKVFQRWAKSRVLYDEVWKRAKDDYNPIFQDFVEEMNKSGSEQDWPDRP
jgi:hypothetical protein